MVYGEKAMEHLKETSARTYLELSYTAIKTRLQMRERVESPKRSTFRLKDPYLEKLPAL